MTREINLFGSDSRSDDAGDASGRACVHHGRRRGCVWRRIWRHSRHVRGIRRGAHHRHAHQRVGHCRGDHRRSTDRYEAHRRDHVHGFHHALYRATGQPGCQDPFHVRRQSHRALCLALSGRIGNRRGGAAFAITGKLVRACARPEGGDAEHALRCQRPAAGLDPGR